MKTTPVANVRMYSASPGIRADWSTLLAWVLDHAGLRWPVIDYPAPAPLNDLWSRGDLGLVAMCGLPLAQRTLAGADQLPVPRIVAAPAPSPPRYGGRAVYFTDIVVRADSPYRTLEDTFGRVVGYTLADSFSGGVALRAHLADLRSVRGGRLYSRAVGNLINGRGVIDALARGDIDVGPLDSYFHDLLRENDPAYAVQVRTVATTLARPSPPLVATAELDDQVLSDLRSSLNAAIRAPELGPVCRRLLIAGFVVPDIGDYLPLADIPSRVMPEFEEI
jgi:ABC-type phosphate/phosphonate transport system substrate-binding protein